MNGWGEQRLVGDSPALQRVVKAAQVVAATDANVLILGESGSGKELVARFIHRKSPRLRRPFLPINCAGMPGESVESELLEHRGQTAGGTLFLDEVAELSPQGQAKLLHFLEAREGGSPAQSEDLRIIAATGRDLWAAVEQGEFRHDLYYRLYVVPLEVPPLRDRVRDIPLLLAHFLQTAARGYRMEPSRFTASAERLLRRYDWPGNVRELRNLCDRMVILFSGQDVGSENLPWEIRRGGVASDGGLGFKLPASGIKLRDLEVEVIRQALALAGGNKSRAARLLGLTRDTLLYRMQKYLIEV